MNSSIPNRNRNDVENLVWLFFGGSFVGYVLVTIDVQSHGWAALVFSFFGSSALFAAFKDRKRDNLVTVAVFGVVLLILIIGQIAGEGLAILATVGVYGHDHSSQNYLYAENYLIFAMIWLLLGVPHRAFLYKLDLDGKGDAQRIIVRILVMITSLMTGAYILLLHFGNGPLHEVSMRALIPGIITTVLLIVPAYRFVAKVCWQRGVIRVFFPRVSLENWVGALTELDTAFYHAAKRVLARRKLEESSGNTSRGNHASRDPVADQESKGSSLRQKPKQEKSEDRVNRGGENSKPESRPSGGAGSSRRQNSRKRAKKVRGKNAAQKNTSGQRRDNNEARNPRD